MLSSWKRISNFFYRISSGRVTLAGFVLFIVFAATVLPAQARKAAVYSHGAGSPDTSRYYSAEDLYAMADKYEPEGRAAYIRARFTFDAIFPITYLFFLGTSLSWCLSIILSASNRLRLLNLFPAFGWLFDMLENIAVSIVFGRYSNPTPVLDSLAGLFTLVKWIFIYGSFILLFPAFLLSLWKLLALRKGQLEAKKQR